MPDQKKPEELRTKFRVISGGLCVVPSLLIEKAKDTDFTLADLDLCFDFKNTNQPVSVEEIIMDGVTVYIDRVEDSTFDGPAAVDPLSDTFIFDNGPKLVR